MTMHPEWPRYFAAALAGCGGRHEKNEYCVQDARDQAHRACMVHDEEARAEHDKRAAPAPLPVEKHPTVADIDERERKALATYMGGYDGPELAAFQNGMRTVYSMLRARAVNESKAACVDGKRATPEPAPHPDRDALERLRAAHDAWVRGKVAGWDMLADEMGRAVGAVLATNGTDAAAAPVASGEWTTLGELRPGAVFETRDNEREVKLFGPATDDDSWPILDLKTGRTWQRLTRSEVRELPPHPHPRRHRREGEAGGGGDSAS